MHSRTIIHALVLVAAFAANPPVIAQEAGISVSGLSLMRGIPGEPFAPTGARIDLEISLPGERILGISPASKIDLMKDDQGTVLIGPGAPGEDETAKAAAEAAGFVQTSRTVNGVRLDSASVGDSGSDVQVGLVATALPAPGATELSVQGTMVVNVVGDDERVVTLENVNLDSDWGTDLEVDGKQLSCRLDSSEKSGNEPRMSRFYCYGNGFKPLRILARGSESLAPETADGRPNVIVRGEISQVTLDFVMPEPRPVEVPLDFRFGLGLQVR
jgi:hypothetical protein